MPDFTPVEKYLETAKGIGWDTCHKIYILMDDEQMDLMRQYGYDTLISATDMTPPEMFSMVEEWYNKSCGLRFVEAVETVPNNPNDGFTTLIPQGADDYEECPDCLERLTQCVCDDDEDDEDEE